MALLDTIRDLEAEEAMLDARLNVVRGALGSLRELYALTHTEAPPTAENGVQRVELAPEGFVRPALVPELPVDPEPEEPDDAEGETYTDPETGVTFAPPEPRLPTNRQICDAYREQRWRERAGRGWTVNYLPRRLPEGEETAGRQLVRHWVENSRAKFLTASAGAWATRMSSSVVSHYLRELEAEGVLAYHSLAHWQEHHKRERAYARVGGVDHAPLVDDAGDGGPAAA